jgi:hypothetical protein
MIGQEQTYTLANDASLTLPALSEGQLTIVMKEEWFGFIRHTIHNPNRMGWPDAADEYPQMGLMLQALSGRTARVVLVVDDEYAIGNLAVYAAAYAHWGFELLIDTATFLRTGVTRVPAEANTPTAQAQTAEQPAEVCGMEVA